MTTTLSTRLARALGPILGRDPLVGLQQEFDDVLNRFRANWDGEWPALSLAPSLDLSETDDSFQVRMDVPGLKAEEIEVHVTGHLLRVTGEHKEDKEDKGRTFHRAERRRGSFARSVALPATVNETKVLAECKDGVLTITLPKSEETKTRKVAVTGK